MHMAYCCVYVRARISSLILTSIRIIYISYTLYILFHVLHVLFHIILALCSFSNYSSFSILFCGPHNHFFPYILFFIFIFSSFILSYPLISSHILSYFISILSSFILYILYATNRASANAVQPRSALNDISLRTLLDYQPAFPNHHTDLPVDPKTTRPDLPEVGQDQGVGEKTRYESKYPEQPEQPEKVSSKYQN